MGIYACETEIKKLPLNRGFNLNDTYFRTISKWFYDLISKREIMQIQFTLLPLFLRAFSYIHFSLHTYTNTYISYVHMCMYTLLCFILVSANIS